MRTCARGSWPSTSQREGTRCDFCAALTGSDRAGHVLAAEVLASAFSKRWVRRSPDIDRVVWRCAVRRYLRSGHPAPPGLERRAWAVRVLADQEQLDDGDIAELLGWRAGRVQRLLANEPEPEPGWSRPPPEHDAEGARSGCCRWPWR